MISPIEIAAVALAFTGVILSARDLFKQKRAEKNFQKILAKQRVALESAIRAARMGSETGLSISQIRSLQALVTDLTTKLNKSEQKQILESLEQPSIRGRIGYLNKLIHLSGSREFVAVRPA